MARAKSYTKTDGTKAWQSMYRLDNREVSGPRFATKRDALAEAIRLQAAGKVPTRKTGLTLEQYAVTELANRQMSPARRLSVTQRVALVIRVAGDLKLSEVNVSVSKRVAADLGNLLTPRSGQPYSSTVIQQAWAQYVRLLKDAQEEGLTSDRVLFQRNVELPKRARKPRRETLSFVERRAFVAALWAFWPDYALLVEVGFATGMRIGELIALTPSDFNPFTQTITVARTVTAGGTSIGETKGHNVRMVPLTEELSKRLRQSIADHGSEWLFPAPAGRGRLHYTNVRLAWDDAVKRAGLVGTITPHLMRRTFSTEFAKAGTSSTSLAMMTGHSDTRTLETVYLHLDQSDARRALAKHQLWTAEQEAALEVDAVQERSTEGGSNGNNVVDLGL